MRLTDEEVKKALHILPHGEPSVTQKFTANAIQDALAAKYEPVVEALKDASKTFEKIAWKRPLDAKPTKREMVAEEIALVGRAKVERVLAMVEAK